MPTSTKSQFVIYDEQFYAGRVERLEQNIRAFNENSRGCIELRSNFHEGDFSQESFFQKGNHVYDRDPTSISAQTATGLAMDEVKSPKVNKGYLIESTLDSFKKLGRDDREMSYVLGQQLGDEIMQKYLNTAMYTLLGGFSVSAVASQLVYTGLSASSITSIGLNSGLRLFGDAAERIQMWVMHSKVYRDLVENQITEKLLEVTAGVLYGGNPATYNRPVLVMDNPALISAGSSTASSADDVYHTFGLTRSAVTIEESEESSVLAETVGGKHNIIARLQGEFAYTVKMKGMSFSAAANPSDATLATGTNWSKKFADKKSLMGIDIQTR